MRVNPVDFDIRVRYVDTDQMGVVHHGNHIVWFEVGRTEFCRSRGFSYHDLEERGYRLMITDLRCRYRKAVIPRDGERNSSVANKRSVKVNSIKKHDESDCIQETENK